MKKWIRWQGLAAFLIGAALCAVFWIFIIDGCVKRIIEETGTRIVGAKVELHDADATLFPFGMILSGLQVTNPKEPMTNAVEASRIAFSVDTLNVLRRKTIINEMTVEGVRFDTPRKTSGAIAEIKEKVPAEREKERFRMPSLEIPDVKTILQNENLDTLKIVDSLKTDIQNAKDTWNAKLADIPGKEKLEEYKGRIEKLKKARKGGTADILGAMGDAKTLKEDLEKDIDQINSVSKSFSDEFSWMKKRVEQAQKAPMEDVRRLRGKYSLSPQGVQNMSRILFGERISAWMNTGLSWYGRLKPVLERSKKEEKGVEVVKPLRGKGLDVRFKEYAPLPDFLIRKTGVSLQVDAGKFSGTIQNITPDQEILGLPLTFTFSGSNLKDIQSIVVNGDLNHINPSRPKDTINARIQKYRINEIKLSDNTQLPLTLAAGLVDSDIRASIEGNAISAGLAAQVKSVHLTSDAKEPRSPLAGAIVSALSSISHFNVQADIKGTLNDYSISLTSDVDRVLRDAAARLVQEQSARLEKMLTSAIEEKTQGPLKNLQEQFGSLAGIGQELDGRKNEFSDLLKEALLFTSKGGIKLPF
jgi:uncharacterized protein (TIGR03545 family)